MAKQTKTLAKVKEPKPTGRPAKYTKEIADLICEEIATTSKSLRTICLDDKLPSVGTILKWLREDENGFLAQYARAKDQQADMLAEEILEISDHTEEDHTPFTGANVVQRDKLRIDARKWIASKLKPKAYGDKLDVTSLGEKIEHTPTTIKWGDKEVQV